MVTPTVPTTPATSTRPPADLSAPGPTSAAARERVIGVLIAAFVSDPVLRWFFPDTDRYLVWFPEVVQLTGVPAFAAGTADLTSSGEAAALWIPPGRLDEQDEEALGEVIERSIDPERLEGIGAFLGQLEEHHPTEPHWYLPLIGTDPIHQGRGHGSALLRAALARADADGRPAYLEASHPRNRALYLRHGFEVVGEIQVADSPPAWPMWRAAR